MLSQLAVMSLIITYSQMFGVSPDVSLAVADVESRYTPNIVGSTGDIGVFQLRPSSFPKFTKTQLLNPYINIPLGIQYLAKMKNECREMMEKSWVICYNVGPSKAKTFKYPQLHSYYKKVKGKIKEHRGYKYAVDFK